MIGLVIVSHSAQLAAGVQELIQQMTQGKARIATAGGIDAPDNPIGTDPMRVLEAIQEVYSEEGVLVLMDLGSALLSAETALDFLEPEQREHIHLCPAPLVEGALAAAVQAVVGSPLAEVCREARQALTVKYQQLGVEMSSGEPTAEGAGAAEAELVLTLENRLGLHARPAARFVTTAGRFKADIRVHNLSTGAGPANAKSIGQVTALGAEHGHRLGITAEGKDAAAALKALHELVAANFGEETSAPAREPVAPVSLPTPEPPSEDFPPRELQGTGVSPGLARGPAYLLQREQLEVTVRTVSDPDTELARLQRALDAAATQLITIRERAEAEVGAAEAEIFDAQRLFLEDPELVEAAKGYIRDRQLNAEAAWQRAFMESAERLRALDSTYLQERAADVEDVGRRVLRLLLDVGEPFTELNEPVVLLAEDLAPSDVVQLDTDQLRAICTAFGGATSHTAILASALGIPAIVGIGPALLSIPPDSELLIDGEAGIIQVAPSTLLREAFLTRQRAWTTARAEALAAAQAPATTRDGHRVEVVANIGSLEDARRALEYGAEGVGLLRTEFLYLDRQDAPDEAAQMTLYEGIAAIMEDRPLVIRTFDIGGDKPLPYLDLPREANPFLGWRGIRLALDRPDLLKTQLRAILRASPGHQLKIMFPMVATLEEVRAARALVDEARAELTREGHPIAEELEIGIMVEIPAAAVMADQLAKEVDFFSIGTNDLSQYTMAADRTNANVNHLADALHPPVLRLIDQVMEAAHEAEIWVGLCGELAGNPLAAPLLLGLGLDEFSMAPPAIPAVKQQLARLTLAQAREIAAEALQLESSQAVQAHVEQRLGELR